MSKVTMVGYAMAALTVGVFSAYAGSITLKTDLSYEPRIKPASEYDGIFLDAKLAINFNAVISPYIGGTIGVGDGLYIFGNIGVEKAFIYNNGFSITPSLGIHAGECGVSTGNALIGSHAIVDFAFSQKRFAPYLTIGARYAYIFDSRSQWSFPLGAGVSLKI